MRHPALRRHGAATKVLVVLFDVLDPERREYRRAKHWYLAERSGIGRQHVGKALAHLAAAGLIVCGPRDGGYPTFRLSDLSDLATARVA